MRISPVIGAGDWENRQLEYQIRSAEQLFPVQIRPIVSPNATVPCALALAGTQQPSISYVAEKHPINDSILVYNPPRFCRTKALSTTLSTEYLCIKLICRVFPSSVFLTCLPSGPGQES